MEKEILFQCHRQKQTTQFWLYARGQTEEMMLLEEHNSVGTATLGTASVAGTMSVVMSMVMSMVMTTNWMWAWAPGRLMGPFMGINGCKVQRGEELGELQATIVVFVCFGKELVYVVIDGHLRLQEDKWGQVSPTHSGALGSLPPHSYITGLSNSLHLCKEPWFGEGPCRDSTVSRKPHQPSLPSGKLSATPCPKEANTHASSRQQ